MLNPTDDLDAPDGRTVFVTRARGQWYVTLGASGTPEPATTGTVVHHVAVAGPCPAVRWSSAWDEPAAADRGRDHLVATITGIATGGFLAVEGVHGETLLLAPADLELLDNLDRPEGWRPTDDPRAVDLADRLAAAGLLTEFRPVQRPEHQDADGPATPVTGPSERRPDPGPPGRIPVYAPWHPESGPVLALGMLTAAVRHLDGGRLNERFEIRVPETADECLADLATRSGPAVLLCSDYVWTLGANLELARAARARCPELFVVHGGPSCPRYEGDAERFLDDHGEVAHVLARGEGEPTLVDLLGRIGPYLDGGPSAVPGDVLRDVAGITFRDPTTGEVVRTEDRDRIATLDDLPSPYLTGEFDHIPVEAWRKAMAIETNRGCPYGCTFCDWGSATMSRIRKFDIDRVRAELQWAADRGVVSINVTDANFGIMSRDVEIARHIAALRRTRGNPQFVAYYPAKNTTKHLAAVMDVLMEAGVGPSAPLSLQSTDPATLEAIARANISNEHFVALAAEFRRRELPLQGELILGLPGQTVESYLADLQFLLDHEITPRTWPLQVLPNAPMNDPEYRDRFAIDIDARNLVRGTSTATADDRARMMRLRNMEAVVERYGLLRHVLRFLQWDHGIAATSVMTHLVDLLEDRPDSYPVLAWTLGNWDLHPAPAMGWTSFYDDARRVVVEELGVAPDTALDTVLRLQQFLMPVPGRSLPDTVDLGHDYVAYYRSATDGLYRDGQARPPDRPLADYGPATFTVEADPLALCTTGLVINLASGSSRDELLPGDFVLGANSANELQSPLTRFLPWVAACGVRPVLPDDLTRPEGTEGADVAAPGAVPVELGRR